MTVRTNAIQVCDRCEKPFTEKHLKAGDEVPVFKQKGLVVTESKGTSRDKEPTLTVLFSFDDMCPDCRKAVDNLLAKVRMDGKKTPKKRKSRKKKEPKPPEGPKTEEYSEGGEPKDTPPEKSEGKPEEKADESTEEPDSEPAKDAAPKDEAKDEDKSEEPAAEAKDEDKSEEPAAEAKGEPSNSDMGESDEQDEDGLVTDPATGDKYDPATGEVKVRGDGAAPEKHPF